MKYFVVN